MKKSCWNRVGPLWAGKFSPQVLNTTGYSGLKNIISRRGGDIIWRYLFKVWRLHLNRNLDMLKWGRGKRYEQFISKVDDVVATKPWSWSQFRTSAHDKILYHLLAKMNNWFLMLGLRANFLFLLNKIKKPTDAHAC